MPTEVPETLFTAEEETSLMQSHSSSSCSFPCVIKDNAFPDLAHPCHQELLQLYQSKRLESSAMGTRKISPSSSKAASSTVTSSGDTFPWTNSLIRGDEMTWITPELCKQENLSNVKMLIGRLIRICSHLRKSHLSAQQQGALSDFSVQFAVYAGEGARYTKHVDSHPPQPGVSEPEYHKRRHLTFVYYLNESFDGGSLRLYKNKSGDFQDVEPVLDRLVAFQSECVEHEVLPSFSTRLALTFWSSGSGSLAYRTRSFGPLHAVMPALLTEKALGDATIKESKFENTVVKASGKIFVNLASYRDSECKRTLVDLFLQAKCPENIYVGLVLQLSSEDNEANLGINFCDRDDSMLCEKCGNTASGADFPGETNVTSDCCRVAALLRSNVTAVRLASTKARGPCYARQLAQSLWREEEFYLQIDSHMRFRKHWDVYLISLYHQCQSIARCAPGIYPVISTYPTGYEISNHNEAEIFSGSKHFMSTCDWVQAICDNDNLLRKPDDVRSTLLVPTYFDSNGMLRQKGRLFASVQDQPVKSKLWAAGFSFCIAKFFLDCASYNAAMQDLFFGEEIVTAARLHTHGAPIFTPPEAVVYHLWSRDHRNTCSSHLEPHKAGGNEKQNDACQSRISAQDRVKSFLFSLSEDDFSVGSVQTISSFETALNVSFSDAKVRVCSVNDDTGAIVPDFADCEEDGLTKMVRSMVSPSESLNSRKIHKDDSVVNDNGNVNIANLVSSFM